MRSAMMAELYTAIEKLNFFPYPLLITNQRRPGEPFMLEPQVPVLHKAPPIAADEECLNKLAKLVERRDRKRLDDAVTLIAQLTAVIEI